MINELESYKAGTSNVEQVKSLLQEYGISSKAKGGTFLETTQWFLRVDEALAKALDIRGEDRFLGVTSILPASTQRNFFRDLSFPIIFQQYQ